MNATIRGLAAKEAPLAADSELVGLARRADLKALRDRLTPHGPHDDNGRDVLDR